MKWIRQHTVRRFEQATELGLRPGAFGLTPAPEVSKETHWVMIGSAMRTIPTEYRGWWRIIDTETWVNDGLDILGPALLSLTGRGDRLRMHCLLAYVDARATKTGVSFSWEGAWEFDPVSGTGSVRLGKDGRLRGRIKIRNGDDSTFAAERTEEPDEPISDPPSYRDKWRRW